VEGFRELAAEGLGVQASLNRLLLLRLPFALVEAWWSGKALLLTWTELRNPDSGTWRQALAQASGTLSMEDLRPFLEVLPPAPAWERCWPWLLLLVPVGLLGLWLHDAAWDHAGLWLLRGLRKERPVAATLAAEAQALMVGTAGVLVTLLGFLPGVGFLFGFLGLPLGLYLWGLRGVALAAHHGCPTWKGVVATLLHLLLFALFACLVLALAWILMMALLGRAAE
jgi:hypothetical protein